LLSLSGIHPRLEETIQATQDWERGRVDGRSLKRSFEGDVRKLVSLQKNLGFDYLSDGQLTTAWQDIFRPITMGVGGLKKGPLVRWFNTNTFYYVPVVDGPIETDGAFVEGKLDGAILDSGKARVCVPDPITFVEACDDRHYHSREKLIFAYCDGVLRPTLAKLSAEGAAYVQFSAPGLVARFRTEKVRKAELSLVGEGIRNAIRGTNLSTGYHTFFGDASPYLPLLFDVMPTDDIGFDLSETDPEHLQGDGKGVIAGVANARSSYVETPRELAARVALLADKFRRITLAPSADLQYVPRSVADEKLNSLSRARRLLA
jgi:methionine synthase II (cobalamin-independent)